MCDDAKLNDLLTRIKEFNEKRDWIKFHSPDNLAKSIVIESSELLECFQWSNTNYNIEDVKEELSDVLIYCFNLCNTLELDVCDIINNKLNKNEIKYPVLKSKGVCTKYDKL